jgi:hypothetical protein
LPKLGIVTQGRRGRGAYNFVQKIFFENPSKSPREKKKVLKLSYLDHRPVHLPCKIEKLK